MQINSWQYIKIIMSSVFHINNTWSWWILLCCNLNTKKWGGKGWLDSLLKTVRLELLILSSLIQFESQLIRPSLLNLVVNLSVQPSRVVLFSFIFCWKLIYYFLFRKINDTTYPRTPGSRSLLSAGVHVIIWKHMILKVLFSLLFYN